MSAPTTAEMEAFNLVYELNSQTEESGHTGPLIFESSGFSSAVTLYGHTVWDTADEGAPYINDGTEQMELREHFMNRMREIKECVIRDIDAMRKGAQP